ncbi:hypothetical protein HK097_009743 [Rhizophlyctis rosea]|uniref:Uncharacterized protein n=1 Tax=Rhizophlyctis rosea TaxID=64517 RepID=A0AAD5X3K6_9FUNG|nr:hypothetical protein HK097_009743 [Rhizophlyctis rosea]
MTNPSNSHTPTKFFMTRCLCIPLRYGIMALAILIFVLSGVSMVPYPYSNTFYALGTRHPFDPYTNSTLKFSAIIVPGLDGLMALFGGISTLTVFMIYAILSYRLELKMKEQAHAESLELKRAELPSYVGTGGPPAIVRDDALPPSYAV